MQTLNQFSPMDNLSSSFNPSFLALGNDQQQQQKLVATATATKVTKGGANNKKGGDSDKPKRPLSAYNLFFQHERAQILKSTPSKYDGKKPRRSHGKIGFGALARSVAAKWNNIEPEKRKRFDELAAADKQRYKKEMDVWKTAQAELKLKQQQANPTPPGMNAQDIVRCNLMAASQASQDTGRAVFHMAASRSPNPARCFFPTLSSGSSGSNNATSSMDNMNMRSGSGNNGNASRYVAHALELLQNDFRNNELGIPQYQQQPMLERIESEESMFSSNTNNGQGSRRNSGTVPHISELAAKLDDDCLGFMSELLF